MKTGSASLLSTSIQYLVNSKKLEEYMGMFSKIKCMGMHSKNEYMGMPKHLWANRLSLKKRNVE